MKLLWIPLLLALLYLLYERGCLMAKSGRALMRVGNFYSAKYKSFHGKLQRVYRPAESRMYCFVFSSELSKGSVQLELLDKEKNQLLLLQGHESREVYLESGKRYLMVLHFRSADGAHHLEIR